MNTRKLTAEKSNQLSDANDTPLIVVEGGQQKRSSYASRSLRIEEVSSIRVGASILHLDQGLYALSVAATAAVTGEHSGMVLPAVHISRSPSDQASGVEIIASTANSGSWLGSEGGTVVIKAPLRGGSVLITTYEPRGEAGSSREVAVRRVDPPVPELIAPAADEPAPVLLTHDIKMEILLHIEGIGDRRMSAGGWVGNSGKKLRIEAFSIYPFERLAPSEIEYKAYGPNGRETPWIGGGKLCGTRGRSLPLTGFAIRLAARQRDRFEIEYQGAFFESGFSGLFRDGEACMARITDDPLEAINVRLLGRR